MPDGKKRSYDSSRRRERALETRARIGEAARTLFEERGFTETSMARIAERAGVATDTVFAIYGNKAALLETLVEEVEASGTAAPILAGIQDALAADEPVRVLALVAKLSRDLSSRLTWATEAMLRGGLGHPQLGASWSAGDARRRAAMRRIASALEKGGHLAPGVSVRRATDLIWSHTGPLLYRLLVKDSGWSPAAYERWLGEALVRQLLTGTPTTQRRS